MSISKKKALNCFKHHKNESWFSACLTTAGKRKKRRSSRRRRSHRRSRR